MSNTTHFGYATVEEDQTLATLTGQNLAEPDAPDSHNILPALIEARPGREILVEHGNVLALRSGNWKYLVIGPGAGKQKNQEKAKSKGPKKPELYDLSKDLSETTNVADQNPEIVAKMAKQLAEIQSQGRSR